ncbi:MAG TPA: FMN-binding protein, partial [Candidatus Omnitrophota bacterium]|nr:FMN-binding protein [Candidatus Omnitrophota bacterium]
NNVKALEVSGYQFYKSSNGSTAFEFSGPGLWGHIYGLASINPGLKAIKAIVILHQEETPGLGARIAEGAFLKQFRGKEFLPKLLFVAEGKSSANNEVDAITGATGSSRALEKLLNETLEKNVSLLSEKNAQESRKEKF